MSIRQTILQTCPANRRILSSLEAKTLQQLEVRIRKCLKQMDPTKIQKTIESAIKRLDDIRKNDIIENKLF